MGTLLLLCRSDHQNQRNTESEFHTFDFHNRPIKMCSNWNRWNVKKFFLPPNSMKFIFSDVNPLSPYNNFQFHFLTFTLFRSQFSRSIRRGCKLRAFFLSVFAPLEFAAVLLLLLLLVLLHVVFISLEKCYVLILPFNVRHEDKRKNCMYKRMAYLWLRFY